MNEKRKEVFMSDNLINEPKVIEILIKELTKLNDESKKRVLDYVYSAFGLTGSSTQTQKNRDTQGFQENSNSNNIVKPTDFWKQKQPNNNYEKFALIGYYLEKYLNKDEYTKDELLKTWKDDFKQTLPAKQVLINSLGHTVKTYHYLLTGAKKGLYRLGIRGNDLVDGLPNPSDDLRGHAKKSKTKAKKKN